MTRLVVLARHAAAASGGDGADHDRPLTGSGLRVAGAAGRWIATYVPTPDLLWCSSARRAVQTWEAMSASLRPLEVRVERELYLASPAEVVARLTDCAPASVVVVGHNPTMEQALAGLCGRHRGFTAGAAAVVDTEAGSLVELWDPPR